jgi:hypothetical protein
MPRPSVIRPAVRLLAVAALLAAIPATILQSALASAAGMMFEAAPFVLAAHLLRGKSLRLLVAAASCGCVRGLPGALSLPAAALCWLSFGPWPALARLLAAGFLAARGRLLAASSLAARARRPGHAEPETAGPLDGLPAIGLGTAAASLAVEGLRSPAHLAGPVTVATGLAAGLFVGIALPCTSAAIAVAAALRTSLPAASIAILVTSGLVTPALRHSRAERPALSGPRSAGGGFALALVACACAALAVRGGAGLVSPRLVPAVAAAVPLALLCAFRARGAGLPSDWLAPAALLAALAGGSPPPDYVGTESTMSDVFPGERIVFAGVTHRSGTSTILQRFAITCCRADAVPVALRTHRPLPVADGAWLEARGRIVTDPGGPALAVERWRRISPPADPYVYR